MASGDSMAIVCPHQAPQQGMSASVALAPTDAAPMRRLHAAPCASPALLPALYGGATALATVMTPDMCWAKLGHIRLFGAGTSNKSMRRDNQQEYKDVLLSSMLTCLLVKICTYDIEF